MSVKILTVSLLFCVTMVLTKAAKTRDTMTPQCPTNWTLSNGHCYYCNSTLTTWDDAKSCCESHNGQLVFVGSNEEFDVIQQLAVTANINSQDLWIGGCYKIPVGKWLLQNLIVKVVSSVGLTCSAAECCLLMNIGDETLGALSCFNKKPFVCKI